MWILIVYIVYKTISVVQQTFYNQNDLRSKVKNSTDEFEIHFNKPKPSTQFNKKNKNVVELLKRERNSSDTDQLLSSENCNKTRLKVDSLKKNFHWKDREFYLNMQHSDLVFFFKYNK